ncbi:hypothetical protein PCASD_26393 [Puccinia coronata f. sp. avenae]|uniref:Uncharacterized protein n=1 Tax=Puccinia coronata f. sp. avenae TaxID=200324 RepID=A0A2N5S544_9BASI|nr:hypothetical protein PCASD_26393 [Puccinia coronata f. sp. avenae]
MANIPPQNTPTTNSTVEKTTNTAPQIKLNKKKAIPWDRDGVNEILELMKENGIHHRDAKGITQRIGDLQTSYNTARDWKRNTGAGILESDFINGVKTVEASSSSKTSSSSSPSSKPSSPSSSSS